MIYTLQFHPDFVKQMKKLDSYQSRLIYLWIEKHLVNKDPRSSGKPLTANYVGSWRYRVGDYRIIAEILDDVLVLHVLMISHRSQSYR